MVKESKKQSCIIWLSEYGLSQLFAEIELILKEHNISYVTIQGKLSPLSRSKKRLKQPFFAWKPTIAQKNREKSPVCDMFSRFMSKFVSEKNIE